MRLVLVRNEAGYITDRLTVKLEDGEVLVSSLKQLDDTRLERLREFIVLDHDGRGPRHGEMANGWKPLTARGLTGCHRGELVLDAGIKYREQHWKRAGVGSDE